MVRKSNRRGMFERESFRVPLNRGYSQPWIGRFDRLNNPEWASRRDYQAVPQAIRIDRLMMGAVGLIDPFQRGAEPRRFYYSEAVHSIVFVVLGFDMPLLGFRNEVRHVLDQSSAKKNIQNLDAAADAENGAARVDKRTD